MKRNFTFGTKLFAVEKQEFDEAFMVSVAPHAEKMHLQDFHLLTRIQHELSHLLVGRDEIAWALGVGEGDVQFCNSRAYIDDKSELREMLKCFQPDMEGAGGGSRIEDVDKHH